MKNKIQKFIEIAIGQKYVEPRKHEERVGDWLLEVGFEKECIKYQPNGSKNPPDWYVHYNSNWISIECKTQKKNVISFFNTYPSLETIYILSNMKYNDTTVFYGYDFYHPKDKDLTLIKDAIGFQNKIQQTVAEYKEIFKNHKYNPNGLSGFGRPDWKQVGGRSVTDMFIEEKRFNNETLAFKRAGKL